MFCNHNPNFVFLLIPKTASRSVISLLQRTFPEGVKVNEHSTTDTPEEYRDYPTACVVRNPYDRVCSAWWFTCKKHHYKDRFGHLTEMTNRGLENTLCNYLKVIQSTPNSKHIITKPQVWWIDKFDVDHIVHFENLRQEFNSLSFIPDDAVLPHRNTTTVEKTIKNLKVHVSEEERETSRQMYKNIHKTIPPRPPWQELVGSEEAELIQEIYKRDFEEFNYPK